jgi:hypothetical protein
MLMLTVVITLEKLLPKPEWVVWISGIAAMIGGMVMVVQWVF